MTGYDQAVMTIVGIAVVAAVIAIPYLHITGKRLDKRRNQHPAE